MTVKQFQKKCEVARRTGEAKLEGGCILYFHGDTWSLKSRNGNIFDTAYNPKSFEYICDDESGRS